MFLTLRGVLLKSFVCNVASLYQCINFGNTLKSVRHLQRDPMRVLPNVLGIPTQSARGHHENPPLSSRMGSRESHSQSTRGPQESPSRSTSVHHGSPSKSHESPFCSPHESPSSPAISIEVEVHILKKN